MRTAQAPELACAYLPALPLQVLRRDHPRWRDKPVVVVDCDKPTARITYADSRALGLGIAVGMRYATAQSLIPGLCGSVVDSARIERITNELVQGLLGLTPRVEPAEAGVIFLDPRGIEGIYGSVAAWAEAIRAFIVGAQFSLTLVVGYSRDRVLALARSSRRAGVRIMQDESQEIALAAALPLASLGAPPKLVHELGRLDITRLSDLARLPPLELAMRFGPEALALHERATASVTRPFQAALEHEPICIRVEVDPPDDDVDRLLFVMKRSLDQLTSELRKRGELLVAAILELALDHAPTRTETLQPARPGLEVAPLLELFRLRLERHTLEAKIVEVALRCESVRAHGRQLDLLLEATTRNEEAASRAVARLAALLGPERVVRITLRNAHLPEAKVVLAPTTTVALPRPIAERPLRLMRRMRAVPSALATTDIAPQHQPLGQVAGGGRYGEVLAMYGPYRISGGWWVREVCRDYYFVETSRGRILWVYRDGPRKRWFLHGEVD